MRWGTWLAYVLAVACDKLACARIFSHAEELRVIHFNTDLAAILILVYLSVLPDNLEIDTLEMHLLQNAVLVGDKQTFYMLCSKCYHGLQK